MTDEFIRRGLATSVAQICSNIGWHSMSNSTLQMMTDILQEYFKELAQSVKKFSEISDTLEPDIDDVKMAFRDKDVVISDLVKYLKQVGSVEFPHKVPKFPIPTKSNLNIMKPGSREIVTRPVYVHEHLPTMYPEQSDEKTIENDKNFNQTPHSSSSLGIFNDPLGSQEPQANKNDRPVGNNVVVHRRLREISSVVMTTSGFLSPSREGKLPESRLMPFPNFKASSSQPSSSYSTVTSGIKNEPQPQSRHKKLTHKTPNNNKEKGKNVVGSNSSSNNKVEEPKVKKLASIKETSKLKALKTGAVRETNQGPRLKKPPKIKDKSKLNLLNTIFDKPLPASSSHSKYPKNPLGDGFGLSSDEKLTTEPDKQKLNIFKKISKVKEDRNNEISVPQNSKSNSSTTSKINSTLVKSDISIKSDVKSELIEEKSVGPIFFKPTIEKKKESVRKPPVEKKHPSIPKPSAKEPKEELSLNTSKKRKKKQKTPSDDFDPPSLEPMGPDTGAKKSKTKHDPDVYSPSLKFSFFGHLPTGPSPLPPFLASNPLVPKYTPPNSILPTLEKSSPSMRYLPLSGEDFEKSEFDELSTSLTSEKDKDKDKISTDKIKPKKEHKKIKKEKIKSKKKKDKKDKTKHKDRSERKKEKLLKKLKNKEKMDSEESKEESTILEEKEPESEIKEEDPFVPKIKLKLAAGSNGSSSSSSVQRKIFIKPIIKHKSPSNIVDEPPDYPEKEKSPVGRIKSSATKSKSHSKDKSSTATLVSVPSTSSREEEVDSVFEHKSSKSKKSIPVPSNTTTEIEIPSTTSGNTSISSSVSSSSATSGSKHKLKPTKKTSKKTAAQKQPAFYFDEAGNQVWICPTCSKQDDGSPMVGCDGCDAWYHWVCVGIQCPPDCAVWFCPTCLLKRAERGVSGTPTEKAKRGRPLKKKSIS